MHSIREMMALEDVESSAEIFKSAFSQYGALAASVAMDKEDGCEQVCKVCF